MNSFQQVLLSLGLGVGIVAAHNFLYSGLTGRPFSYSHDVEPVNAAIIALPFLLLTVFRVRRLKAWLSGVVVTIILWGYALYRGVAYQWNPDGTGADIGLGILLTMSPIFVLGAALATSAVIKDNDR